MDIFKEQLLKIKRSPAEYALMAVIVIVALVISVMLFLFSGQYPIFILFIVAVFYGSAKLLGMFSIEYEYIVTNSTVDIDKIISKSSRKRLVSFECKDIVRCEKVSTNAVIEADDRFICCNKDDSNAYWLLVKSNNKRVLLMVAPNEAIIEAIKSGTPKNIAREIFN